MDDTSEKRGELEAESVPLLQERSYKAFQLEVPFDWAMPGVNDTNL